MNHKSTSKGIPRWMRFAAVTAFIAAALPFGNKMAAQAPEDYVYMVRAIEMSDLEIGSLGAITYSAPADSLLALQAEPGTKGRVITMIDRNENVLGTSIIEAQPSLPLEMAFNREQNNLFILNPSNQEMASVSAEPGGFLPPEAAAAGKVSLAGLGLPQIQGLDFEAGGNRLFLLDPSGKNLVILTPDQNGSYDSRDAAAQGRVEKVDLKAWAEKRLQGVAFYPDNGHLFTVSQDGSFLYEFTTAGDLVSARDISSFGLKNPQSIVTAPSGDDTDDPAIQSLYIADTGANQIVEVSITAAAVMALPAASPVSLVNTIVSSRWNPPSPDSSGVDYDPIAGQLKVSDSEVDEMKIFAGVNVYQSTTGGSLQSTCSTLAYSKEPSGLSVNTDNGNLFISDDSKKLLHEIDLGPDRRYCTADDRVRTANTSTYGATDPEGVDYGDGKIFIAGGKNSEVYVVSPGSNGVFDGAPPAGDDRVDLHFDTAVIGLRDPEGIGFHPDRRTLFIVSRSDKLLVETSQSGTVLRVFNITFLNAISPAGVGLGPGSQDPSAVNVYVSQRGIDNNIDPNENDGKVYELNIGDVSGPQPTPTSTPTPGPTPTPTPVTDGIFSDGFESGNLSAWTSSATNAGDLSASGAAAIMGSFGLKALINDNNSLYVSDDTPNGEPQYRARFYFDPNSISMVSGDNLFLLQGLSGASRAVVRVQFRFSSGAYQVRAGIQDDASTWSSTAYLTVSNQPHFVEINWVGSSAPGANSGSLDFWIDGVQQGSLTGIDNDTLRIDSVRLGAVAGIDTGTRGTIFLDEFDSRRQSYIGP